MDKAQNSTRKNIGLRRDEVIRGYRCTDTIN